MPTDRQIDAAIEGARDMVESSRSATSTDQDPVHQRGGGGGMTSTGTAQGGSNSPIGIDDTTDPSAETGGPRGAGTSVSGTSGGRVNENDPEGVEPDEFVKRETAVFEPGTQKKPSR
jgi:hypothetical protein